MINNIIHPLDKSTYLPIRLVWYWLTWEAVLTKDTKTCPVRKAVV